MIFADCLIYLDARHGGNDGREELFMLKEKILLSIAAGMLTTTCALAPTLANCTSVTQADVDKMSGIEKLSPRTQESICLD